MHLKSILLTSLLILLSCSSCFRVSPPFCGTEASTKAEWIDEGDPRLIVHRDTDLRDLFHWWEQFQDPTLNSLVQMANGNNLDLKIAAARIAAARAELGIAYGLQFPQTQALTGSSTYQQGSRQLANTAGGADLSYWTHALGLNLAWELDFWGRYRMAIEAGEASLFASYADQKAIAVLVSSEIASHYIRLRAQQAVREIVKKNAKTQARGLEIAQARFEGGMVTELDVKQAETLLYNTQARLPEIDLEIRRLSNALAYLLGLPASELDGLIPDEHSPPIPPHVLTLTIPCKLLLQRPDARRAYYNVIAQNARVGVATTDLYPQISLVGLIGFQSSTGTQTTASGITGDLFSGSAFTTGLGPSFSWPIYNYGRITSRIHLEQARLCEAILNYRRIVLKAHQEVEDGIALYLLAQDQEAIREKSAQSANRSVSLAFTQYVEGTADFTRVLETLRALLDEEERWVQSRAGVALGAVGTYRALGGGW